MTLSIFLVDEVRLYCDYMVEKKAQLCQACIVTILASIPKSDAVSRSGAVSRSPLEICMESRTLHRVGLWLSLPITRRPPDQMPVKAAV